MAAGIGERLREARSARGLDLDQVSERTKIRPRLLRALEEEQWDVLPSDTYARAFLRTYAELLGLDGDALAAEFQRLRAPPEGTEASQQPAPRQLGRPAAPISGRRRVPTWAAVAAALLGGGLAALLAIGLLGGSDEPDATPGRAAAGDTTETTTTEPAEVEVRLRPTAEVWVCMVDQNDRPVVEGVTLAPGDDQGPFTAEAFRLTLGNGSVRIEANGEPIEVPALAEPQGWRLTPDGASELPSGLQPSCT